MQNAGISIKQDFPKQKKTSISSNRNQTFPIIKLGLRKYIKSRKLVWTNKAYSFRLFVIVVHGQGIRRSLKYEAKTTLDIRTTNTRSCNTGILLLAKNRVMALKLQPWSPDPILQNLWEQFLTWMPMIWKRSTHTMNVVTLHPVSYVAQKQ